MSGGNANKSYLLISFFTQIYFYNLESMTMHLPVVHVHPPMEGDGGSTGYF